MDEDLVGCPPSSRFALPVGVDYLVGHNVDYDWNVAGCPDVKRIDTLALAREYYPDAGAHSLSALLYLLDRANARERLRTAHSALTDVLICRDVLAAMLRGPLAHIRSWDELWRASEEARIPKIMPFGKHRNERIEDVPDSYKAWALQNIADMDPYLRIALEKSLRQETP